MRDLFPPSRALRFISFISVVLWAPVSAAPLTVLFTNDIHDHLLADYDGRGGMAYVSGYVRSVRKEAGEILLVDSGDVAEKGDLVARRSWSRLNFQAMARMGYDAWAPGNHDHDLGMEALREFEVLSGADLLCINLLDAEGGPALRPSKVYEKQGVRIGVLGMIAPRSEDCLDHDETARAMAEESRRLRPEVDLIFALCHYASRDCADLARKAPEIDIFFSAHSHEILEQPVVVEETGALIVQAGSYAEFVGHLELRVDPETGEIEAFSHRLVPMDHHRVPADIPMLEWFRREEAARAPEANRWLGWSGRELHYGEVGVIAAAAIRRAAGAEIALHSSGQVIRSKLPAGALNYNAVYRTGGERGEVLLEVVLSGREIEAYLRGLLQSDWYLTQWSGFFATLGEGGIQTDLDPGRDYRVVLPQREWEKRFLPLFEKIKLEPGRWQGVAPLNRSPEARRLEITWMAAAERFFGTWAERHIPVDEGLAGLAAETGQDAILRRLLGR